MPRVGLDGADLRMANLKGANLEGALFITQEQLDEANGNDIEIKFPDATGPSKRSHTIRPR